MAKKKVALAWSGGLDTSAIVPWLIDEHDAEVVCICIDLGNADPKDELEKWAYELGAVEFYFDDVQDEFCQDYVYPAIRGGAIYEDDYLLGTSLARPLISKRIAEIALKTNCTAVSHGATGKGNDQLRFERSWAYLCPDLEIIAPWKQWDFKGRQDLGDYLHSKGFKIDVKDKRYSEDVNLMHRSCEGGVLEDPSLDYDQSDVQEWVITPDQIPNTTTDISIEFAAGIPVAVNGKKLGPAQLLMTLNEIAGKNGIGADDIVENRIYGTKSRGIYETPGGKLLHFAIKQLKAICWSRDLNRTARTLSHQYGELIYDGLWFTDALNAINAFYAESGKVLTGTVELAIINGQLKVKARKSPYSLYDVENISFDTDTQNLNMLATGYCHISGLNMTQQGRRDQKTSKDKKSKAA